jgi:hypothetical protein
MWVRRIALALALVSAGPLAAQNFHGQGSHATEKFSLGEGVAVFDLQHKGDGTFTVRLLDDSGNVVGEMASGSGVFSGSKTLRIEKTGLYLIDVAASGEWSVRLRRNEVALAEDPANPETGRGREAGAADASRVSTAGWLVRGFLGGALLGPIGTGVAIAKAGSSAESSAAEAAQAQTSSDLAYATSWQIAYLDRLRMRRQRSALIGGAVGTGVLLVVLFQFVDLGGVSEDDVFGEPLLGVVIPIRW